MKKFSMYRRGGHIGLTGLEDFRIGRVNIRAYGDTRSADARPMNGKKK